MLYIYISRYPSKVAKNHCPPQKTEFWDTPVAIHWLDSLFCLLQLHSLAGKISISGQTHIILLLKTIVKYSRYCLPTPIIYTHFISTYLNMIGKYVVNPHLPILR